MAADEDSLGVLIFVVAVLALAAVAMLRIFGWNYIKGWLATGWSTTQARVEFGSVEEHRIRYFTYYVARIDLLLLLQQQILLGLFRASLLAGNQG